MELFSVTPSQCQTISALQKLLTDAVATQKNNQFSQQNKIYLEFADALQKLKSTALIENTAAKAIIDLLQIPNSTPQLLEEKQKKLLLFLSKIRDNKMKIFEVLLQIPAITSYWKQQIEVFYHK